MGFKEFCTDAPKKSCSDPESSEFLQVIKIRHFLQRVRFDYPTGGADVGRSRTIIVQPSTNFRRVADGAHAKSGEYRFCTDTSKGEERTCEEKSASELSAWVYYYSGSRFL
jgi:hypothetical protein